MEHHIDYLGAHWDFLFITDISSGLKAIKYRKWYLQSYLHNHNKVPLYLFEYMKNARKHSVKIGIVLLSINSFNNSVCLWTLDPWSFSKENMSLLMDVCWLNSDNLSMPSHFGNTFLWKFWIKLIEQYVRTIAIYTCIKVRGERIFLTCILAMRQYDCFNYIHIFNFNQFLKIISIFFFVCTECQDKVSRYFWRPSEGSYYYQMRRNYWKGRLFQQKSQQKPLKKAPIS